MIIIFCAVDISTHRQKFQKYSKIVHEICCGPKLFTTKPNSLQKSLFFREIRNLKV